MLYPAELQGLGYIFKEYFSLKNMLVKILGGIDVLLGVFLIFINSLNFSKTALMIFGIILLIKGSLGLFKNFACWVDGLAGFVFLLAIVVSIPGIICIILGLLLLQKGIFSFL